MKNSRAMVMIGVLAVALFASQAAISSDRGNTAHVWGKSSAKIMDTQQTKPKCTTCHDTDPTTP